MPFLCKKKKKKKKKKKMLFCICPDITTSELYKRLGGTQSLVETFHSSVAPLLMRDASAQGSWRLHTAAMGSPGLTVGHSLGGTPQWTPSPGKQKPISLHLLCEGLKFVCYRNVLHPPPPRLTFTYSRKHFQDSGMAKHGALKEGLGSSLLLVKGSLLQYLLLWKHAKFPTLLAKPYNNT
uniref:Uncharacterized protein n=1 Tax=Felis catus TaxID=9685 RepID=A0ABI7XSM7_FELCA